jgi:hypothetical protein
MFGCADCGEYQRPAGAVGYYFPTRTAHALEVRMTAMRSLAIIVLLIGGNSLALAQSAPPTNGYPPFAAGAAGNPATYGPPGGGVTRGAPGPPFQFSAYRHSHRYIVIPLTRDYGWWPQGQYRWFPFGLARWAYWCEPASYHRLSCGVGGRH